VSIRGPYSRPFAVRSRLIVLDLVAAPDLSFYWLQ